MCDDYEPTWAKRKMSPAPRPKLPGQAQGTGKNRSSRSPQAHRQLGAPDPHAGFSQGSLISRPAASGKPPRCGLGRTCHEILSPSFSNGSRVHRSGYQVKLGDKMAPPVTMEHKAVSSDPGSLAKRYRKACHQTVQVCPVRARKTHPQEELGDAPRSAGGTPPPPSQPGTEPSAVSRPQPAVRSRPQPSAAVRGEGGGSRSRSGHPLPRPPRRRGWRSCHLSSPVSNNARTFVHPLQTRPSAMHACHT